MIFMLRTPVSLKSFILDAVFVVGAVAATRTLLLFENMFVWRREEGRGGGGRRSVGRSMVVVMVVGHNEGLETFKWN